MTKTQLDSRFLLFLQLFADGGADGSATGAGNTGANETDAASQPGDKDLPITFLDEEREEEAPAAEEPQETEKADADAEFLSLIKKGGKYAEQYQKHFQEQLNGRMKAYQDQTKQLEQTQKVMQKLAQVYGKEPDDIEGIAGAVDADDELYANAAAREDMSVEAFKEVSNMRVENALMKKANAEREQQEAAEKTFRSWMEQSEKVKEIYPSFDIEQELQNPTFANLLRNGFEVLDAYQSAHINEILPQAMQAAAQVASKKIAKSYAANQARPDENASSRSAAATVKRDVASLTDEELDEIDRLSRKRPITLG